MYYRAIRMETNGTKRHICARVRPPNRNLIKWQFLIEIDLKIRTVLNIEGLYESLTNLDLLLRR